MSERHLPTFLLVGTGKAGTTSLYHYLNQHPQIYMSPMKEPCYFADEIRAANLSPAFARHVRRQSRALPGGRARTQPFGWLVSDWEEYADLFRDVRDQKAIGEATASYLWSATAPANIRRRLPQAKIVMILRDPAERAFSQYQHQLAEGMIQTTFRRHVEDCLRHTDRRMSVHYPFLEVGLYAGQLQRYLDLFPRPNIRIYWYEDCWRQSDCLFRDLFEFLEVDPGFRPDRSRKSLPRRTPKMAGLNRIVKRYEVGPALREVLPTEWYERLRGLAFAPDRAQMSAADRACLVDYYRDDIRRLEGLSARELGHWLQ